MKINPFEPNSPVSSGMFVGRLAAVERLETLLLQTRAGHPGNFLITGERGIGKSSLLNYMNHVAAGRIPLDVQDGKALGSVTLSFLVIHTDIDPRTTQLGLVRN